MSKESEIKNSTESKTTLSFVDRVTVSIIKFFYRIWSPTIRYNLVGKIFYEKPVIYIFWHNKLFGLIRLMRGRGINVLVSKHRDGEKIVRITEMYGYKFIRGSTSWGGATALKKIVATLDKGGQIGITPDGPKGPRWKFQEGALFASRVSRKPLIFVGVGYSKKIVLNTWDRFEIPLPFSKCVVYSSPPYYVKKGDTPEKLEKMLREYTLKAEALADGKI